MRQLLAGVTALVLTTAAVPGNAATIITSGNYTAGQDTALFGNVNLGPGTYRFALDLTSVPSFVSGDFFKTIVYNEFCDFMDGSGVVYCGGDDTISGGQLTVLTPTRYVTTLTVNPFISGPIVGGGIRVAFNQSEICCSYQIDFSTPTDGRYVLSYGAVPEPAVWTLMILGIGASGAALRRRHEARLLRA
ncbi:MAG: PEPxxWA-CTERM sorting domain-containing protein [Novosphingobium sp.]